MKCWTRWIILIRPLQLSNFTCGQTLFNFRMDGITPIIPMDHMGIILTHGLVPIGDPTGVIIPIGDHWQPHDPKIQRSLTSILTRIPKPQTYEVPV